MSFSLFSFVAVLVTLASAVDVGDDARLLRREMQTPDNGQPTAHHKNVRKIEREAEWAERLERHDTVNRHSSGWAVQEASDPKMNNTCTEAEITELNGGHSHAGDWKEDANIAAYLGYRNPDDARFKSAWNVLSPSMDYCPATHGQDAANKKYADDGLLKTPGGSALKGGVIARNQALTSGPWINFVCTGGSCQDADQAGKLFPFKPEYYAGSSPKEGTLTTSHGANIIWPKFSSTDKAAAMTGSLIATRCLGERLETYANQSRDSGDSTVASTYGYEQDGKVAKAAISIEQQYTMFKANGVKMLFSLAPSLFEMKHPEACDKACMGVSKRSKPLPSWGEAECHPYHESDASFAVKFGALGENKMVDLAKQAAVKVWPGATFKDTECLDSDLKAPTTVPTGECRMDGGGCGACRFRKTEIMDGQNVTLTHYWYLHWHDYKVPKKEDMLLWLRLLHEKALPIMKSGNVAAHCWSGKGRTGTILALLAIMQDFNKSGCPTDAPESNNAIAQFIADSARHFRSVRINMVERPWQFGWVLTAATMYAANGCKADGLSMTGFDSAAGKYKASLENKDLVAMEDCCASSGGSGSASGSASGSG